MLDDDDEFSDEGEDEVEKKRRKKKREKQRKREEKKAAGTAGVTTTTSATIAAATGGQPPSGETLCTISLNVFLLLECVLSDKYKKINFVTFFLLTFFLFFSSFSSRFLLSLSPLAFSSYRLALKTVKMDRFRRPSNDRATLIHTHTINYYIYHF